MAEELKALQAELEAVRAQKGRVATELAKPVDPNESMNARTQRTRLQRKAKELDARIRQLEPIERRLLDQAADREATRSAEARALEEARTARAEQQAAEKLKLADAQEARAFELKLEQDRERFFWYRRFHTSLAIAHGAGAAAIASKLLDKDTLPAALRAGVPPFVAFAVGMCLAGLLPVLLFLNARRTANAFAGVSAALFLVGVGLTILGLTQLAWPG